MIHHILVTRFNLNIAQWQSNRNELSFEKEEWLFKRIPLFLKFCLPSVIQQNCKNFKWFIFFEDGTQGSVNELVENLKQYSFITPIFVNGMSGFNKALQKYIVESMPKSTLRIVTTRLDNDDAINRDFIKNIQKATSDDIDKFLIDFPEGLCLSIIDGLKLSKYKFPKNQFISLVEKVKENESPSFVFSNFHHKLDTEYPVKSLKEKKQWLQIVHEDNLVNGFKGVLTYTNALKRFPDYDLIFKAGYNGNILKIKIKQFFKKLPGYYRVKIVFNKYFD